MITYMKTKYCGCVLVLCLCVEKYMSMLVSFISCMLLWFDWVWLVKIRNTKISIKSTVYKKHRYFDTSMSIDIYFRTFFNRMFTSLEGKKTERLIYKSDRLTVNSIESQLFYWYNLFWGYHGAVFKTSIQMPWLL